MSLIEGWIQEAQLQPRETLEQVSTTLDDLQIKKDIVTIQLRDLQTQVSGLLHLINELTELQQGFQRQKEKTQRLEEYNTFLRTRDHTLYQRALEERMKHHASPYRRGPVTVKHGTKFDTLVQDNRVLLKVQLSNGDFYSEYGKSPEGNIIRDPVWLEKYIVE
jgi:hypothetical protein